MAVVTILGAGAMGAALTTPALAAGNEVRLWGTWLDDDILAALRAGRPHPRIDVPIDRVPRGCSTPTTSPRRSTAPSW